MAQATPIHNASQGDYRLAQQCGADDITAENVAVAYRLDGGARPIERIGRGWSEFGLEAGTVLETSEDVEGVRRLLAGRDPHTRRTLVKPKVATAPAAMLPAAPFVAALEAAAAERGVSLAALVAKDPWSLKRVGRLERGLKRDSEHHRAPVADLERVAKAAGIDMADVFEHQELKEAQEHRDERVRIGTMGFDVTFDRPKGISVLQGLADPAMAARMEQIHLEAVRESVTALEGWVGYAMSGHHGDGQVAKRLDTSGLVATMTVHRTARPVDADTPGDPHLHTHVMLANLARGSDGKWRTIAAGGRDLMRHVPAVGELYRALEREKLTREFGLTFAQDPRTGRWDVVGVPNTLKKTFSRRQAQIREHAGPDASVAQGQTVARATARAKVASTPEKERESWHERAVAAGHPPRQVVAAALEGREPGEPTAGRGPGPDGPRPINPDAVAAAVWDPEHGVTAHTKIVTRARVMAHVAGTLQGGLPNAAALEALTDHVLAHDLALALPAAGPVHMSHADRYTSADIPAAEHTIMTAARERRGVRAGVVDVRRASHAIRSWQRQKGFALSQEQLGVVARLIGHGHGIDAVLGVAGAGKTTIMSAARTAWETHGYRVEGAAVAAVAAAGLRAEAGITSRTVASWRKRIEDGPGLRGVHVLVLDEAAMIGDRDLALLVEEAGRTRTKLVMIGDPLQLRSVAAGGSFAHVHEAVDGLTLSENRRQRREVDQAALKTWRAGARRSALAMWGDHGLVHATVDADAAHDQMAAAWWRDRQAYPDSDGHDAVERLLMVATTNNDVAALNERARAAARTGGLLEGPDVSFTCKSGEELVLAAGDQVRVRANDYRSRTSDDPDVLNGYRGLVREVDPERGALVEWRREGEVESAWIGPAALERGDLSHGYAVTIAAAQGVTVDRCHVYGLGADAHGLYAGMSRAKERTDLYLPAVELEREEVRQRLGEARSEEERCARVISAYADTLTQDPPGLVLAELEESAPPIGQVSPARPEHGRVQEHERDRTRDQDREHVREPAAGDAPATETAAERTPQREAGHRQEREDVAPTPWRPLTLEEVHAGQGPHCQAVADQVAELDRRAAELEASLPELREESQAARDRAYNTSRVRLLLEGTTPKAARTEAEQVGDRLREAMHGANEARAQSHRLWSEAQHQDMRQHLADAQRQHEEATLERMEPIALQHGLTREELHALDREERDHMLRRHAIQASAPDYQRLQDQNRIELTAAEERQLRWEEMPEHERAERTAAQERAAQAQREYAERMQREAAQRNAPGLEL